MRFLDWSIFVEYVFNFELFSSIKMSLMIGAFNVLAAILYQLLLLLEEYLTLALPILLGRPSHLPVVVAAPMRDLGHALFIGLVAFIQAEHWLVLQVLHPKLLLYNQFIGLISP